MLNRLYRAVAWICIIAHFNLIMPSFHGAHAMHFDEDGTIKNVQRSPSLPQKAEDPLQAEQNLPSKSSTFSHYLWEKATAVDVSDALNFLSFSVASLIDGANSSSYVATYALSTFLDIINSPHGKQMVAVLKENTNDIVKKTLKEVPKLASSIPSTFIFSLFFKTLQAIEINKGDVLDIQYNNYKEGCSGYWPYEKNTAPFLIGVGSNQIVKTKLEFGLYDQKTPFPVGSKSWKTFFEKIDSQTKLYMQSYPDSMNASVRNFTRSFGSFPTTLVDIESTAEILKDFLLHFQTYVMDCKTYLTTFEYFNNNNDPLINASRKFFPWSPPVYSPPYTTVAEGFTLTAAYGGLALFTGCLIYSGLLCTGCIKTPKCLDWQKKDIYLLELLIRNDTSYDMIMEKLNLDEAPLDELRRERFLEVIQKHEVSLEDNQLIHLCSYIRKYSDQHDTAVDIQVNRLNKVLDVLETEDTVVEMENSFKDDFLEKFNLVDTDHRQHITWQYFQKHEEDIRNKGVRRLFDMYALIDPTHHPFHEEYLDLLEKSLKDLRDHELDTLEGGTLIPLCNHIKQDSPYYVNAVDIQIKSLSRILDKVEIVTCFKDVFLEKLQLVDLERQQDITWKYLLEYQENIRAKGVRPLFEMCTLIEEPHEEFPALAAKSLLGFMDQEQEVQKTSMSDCLKIINVEIQKIKNSDRRQDLTFELIDKSNLNQKIKVALCDKIQPNHPGYNKALIHKANIIWGNEEQTDGEKRFNEAMNILIQLPNDPIAKESRKDFIQQRWDSFMSTPLPTQLKDFDPTTENDLNIFYYIIKEQENKLIKSIEEQKLSKVQNVIERDVQDFNPLDL